MHAGWSINLSAKGYDFYTDKFPVSPMYQTSLGPVVEIVFWSQLAERWIHAVSEHFMRRLPKGHIQVTIGDLAWLRQVVRRMGEAGVAECVIDLELCQMPRWDA